MTFETIRECEFCDSLTHAAKEFVRLAPTIKKALEKYVNESNGNGTKFVDGQGNEIYLTPELIEQVYRYRDNQYLREDALNALGTFFGIDPDDMDNADKGVWQKFTDTWGFSFDEAVNSSSDNFILDKLVSCFSDRQDCDIPENDTWNIVIGAVLKEQHNGR